MIDKDTGPNRRDFSIATAGVLAGGTAAADAREADPLGPGFDLQPPLRANWHEQLGAVVHVDYDLDAKELKDPAEQERHRIYCYHLMKLMCRFCNDNKNGPFGIYPQRDRQQLAGPKPADDASRLYIGDMNPTPTATVPTRTAISGTISLASRSTAAATSSISISITTPFSEAPRSTPSRGWFAGCSA